MRAGGAFSPWRVLALAVVLAGGLAAALGSRLLEGAFVLQAWSEGRPADRPVVCSFRARTGVPCVGCGGTRAFRLGVRGALAEAAAVNPLGAYSAAAAWMVYLGALGTLLVGKPALLKVPLLVTFVSSPVVVVATVLWWWWALPPGAFVSR